MKGSKTRKILLTLLATTMVVGSLVGCSKGTTTSKTETSNAPVVKTKVVVWSNNRHDLAYMTKMVADFNAIKDNNVEIEYVVQADNYTNMVTMAASSGQHRVRRLLVPMELI